MPIYDSGGVQKDVVGTANYSYTATVGIGVSGSTNSNVTGTLVFQNSNNVSFGLNGQSITATASYSQSTAPGTIGVSNTTVSKGAVLFSNNGNVTFGAVTDSNGATLSASVAGGGAALSAGTASQNTGTIIFSDSNGLAFGLSAGTLTGSYSQSTHSHSTAPAAIIVSGGTADGTVSAGSVVFANSNGVSFGHNASTITASYSQSTHSHSTAPGGIAAGGSTKTAGTVGFLNSNGISFAFQTGASTDSIYASYTVPTQTTQPALGSISVAGNTAGTVTAGSGSLILAGGPNVTLSGATAAGAMTISVSAAAPGGAGDGFNRLAAGGVTAPNSTTVNFANANGVSFGFDALSTQITASHNALTSQSNQAISAGNGSFTFQTLSLADSAGVSWSTGTQGLFASVKTDYLTTAAQVSHSHGNPTLALTNLNGTTASASNGVTFSLSAAAQSVQTQNLVSILGSTGAISFANSNGISIGGNASTITLSHNGLTSQSNQAISAANGSSAFQTLSFADSGGVSWSTGTQGLYATVKTDYLTTAAVSTHSHGNPTLNLTNINGTTASASNGLTLSLSVAAQSVQTQNLQQATISGNTAGVLAAISSGTLTLAGGNNITISQNGNALTISGPNVGGAQTGISSIIASDITYTNGSVQFTGAGIITVSANNTTNPITISASQSVQTQSTVAVLGSTGAISFANSNGISFGGNASTITASHNGITQQSTQPAVVLSVSGGGSLTAGTAVLSNSNGVSFGFGTGTATHVLTASHNALTSQSVQTQGMVSVLGSTGNISFGNANGVSFSTNGSTIYGSIAGNYLTSQSGQAVSAANGSVAFQTLTMADSGGVSWSTGTQGLFATVKTDYLTTQSNQAFSASGGSSAFQTLNFANSNGFTFSNSNGSVIGSYTVPTVPAQTNESVSAGNGSYTFSVLKFADSQGVSFSTGTQGIFATVKTDYLTSQSGQAVSAGNGSVAFQTLTFADSNGVSFSTGTQGIYASYTQSVGLQAVSAGTQVKSGGVLKFVDSNGIFFGASSVAGNITLTASYTVPSVPAQSTQTATLIGSGNTLNAASTAATQSQLTFHASGAGLSVGVQNNAVIYSLNALTTAAQSDHSHGNPTLALTNLSGTTASASNGVTLSLSGHAPLAVSADGTAAAGSNLQSTGTIKFANSNGLTFGLSNNGTMTASYAPLAIWGSGTATSSQSAGTLTLLNFYNVSWAFQDGMIAASASYPAQTNQTLGVYAASNTTQSSSGTIDARSLTFQGAGIASIGVSNGSVIVSVPAGGGVGDGYNILAAGTRTAGTANTVVFSDSNGISFGMNTTGGSIITASISQATLSNSNNVSFGAAAGVITASATHPMLFSVGATNTSASTMQFGTTGNQGLTWGLSNGSVVASVNTVPDAVSILGNSAGTNTWYLTNDTLYISGGNNITVSGNAGTLVISAAAGGGGATMSHWPPYMQALGGSTMATTQSGAAGGTTNITGSMFVYPVQFVQPVTFNAIQAVMTLSTNAGTGSGTAWLGMGLYTLNGSTMSLVSSFEWNGRLTQNSLTAVTANAWWGSNSTSNSFGTNGTAVSSQVSGIHPIILDSTPRSIAAGQYYAGFIYSCSTSSVNIFNLVAAQFYHFSNAGTVSMGQPFWGNGSNLSSSPIQFQGLIGVTGSNTAASAVLNVPASFNTSAITCWSTSQMRSFFFFVD